MMQLYHGYFRTMQPVNRARLRMINGNSMQLIEHISCPEHFMRECWRVLQAGGQLHIEAPDVRMTMMPHIPLLRSDRGTLNFWDDPTHLRPYSRVALRRLVEAHGFHTIGTFYARKWAHLSALPAALLSRDNNYWAAFFQTVLGHFCAVHADRPCGPQPVEMCGDPGSSKLEAHRRVMHGS